MQTVIKSFHLDWWWANIVLLHTPNLTPPGITSYLYRTITSPRDSFSRACLRRFVILCNIVFTVMYFVCDPHTLLSWNVFMFRWLSRLPMWVTDISAGRCNDTLSLLLAACPDHGRSWTQSTVRRDSLYDSRWLPSIPATPSRLSLILLCHFVMELRHFTGMENGSHGPDSTIIANCITERCTGDTTVEGDIIHSCTEGDVIGSFAIWHWA